MFKQKAFRSWAWIFTSFLALVIQITSQSFLVGTYLLKKLTIWVLYLTISRTDHGWYICLDIYVLIVNLSAFKFELLLQIWFMSSIMQIRPLWRHYFQNTQGLIFVVDSNDRDRVVEARDELHRMLNEVTGDQMFILEKEVLDGQRETVQHHYNMHTRTCSLHYKSAYCKCCVDSFLLYKACMA